jgi:hypothetical protein
VENAIVSTSARQVGRLCDKLLIKGGQNGHSQRHPPECPPPDSGENFSPIVFARASHAEVHTTPESSHHQVPDLPRRLAPTRPEVHAVCAKHEQAETCGAVGGSARGVVFNEASFRRMSAQISLDPLDHRSLGMNPRRT